MTGDRFGLLGEMAGDVGAFGRRLGARMAHGRTPDPGARERNLSRLPRWGRKAFEAAEAVMPANPTSGRFEDMLAFVAGMPNLGATVYHGTRHRFPPTPKNPHGEFDMSKMGTGAGGQSYGYGTYLTDRKATGKGYAGNDGVTYSVDLPDEHIANMLDWDAPLAQQPEFVKKALSGVPAPALRDGMALAGGGTLRIERGSYFLEMSGKRFPLRPREVENLVGTGSEGRSLYQSLSASLGGDAAASEYLKKVGIPGVKYLDPSLRHREYVVWDNILNILGIEP